MGTTDDELDGVNRSGSAKAGPALPSSSSGGDAGRISKPERLLNLVAFLLSSRNAVPFAQIKGRVAGYDDDASPEALEKRFDRDKAELRGLGVPIVYEPLDEHGHEGYRIPREQYFLPEIRLGVEEAAALAVVQRYAQTATADPLARPLASALRKVVVDSPLTGAAAASITEQHMLGVRTEELTGDVGPNLEVLTDAVLRRRAIRFRYYSIGRDEENQREVEPYGLGWHDRHWYVVGRDRGRDAERRFRVDRIRGRARILAGPVFNVPEDFDVSKHVDRPAFLLRRDGQGERVTVELRPDVAFMARDALREGWTYDELPGGAGLLEFDATDRRAVVRFVARHMDRARVTAPAEVREMARSNFRSILAAHEGPATVAPAPAAKRGGRRP
ncbi:MAG: WYL domain-containing protein [Planctomycetes bacterium]|nr:WYL domain-containing protein [Planctomycetota bacterium]